MGVKFLGDTKHFQLGIGYWFGGSLTGIQLHVGKKEIYLRLDILFFGLYVGWLS